MTRERDLMAQVEVLKRERDAAREGIVSLDASKRHLVKEVERLTSALASERARVGELERALRQLVEEHAWGPGCGHPEDIRRARALLPKPAPSPGTDHEDRHG